MEMGLGEPCSPCRWDGREWVPMGRAALARDGTLLLLQLPEQVTAMVLLLCLRLS